MIRFGAWSIILLIGAVPGVFISAGILTRRKNRAANVFLSALVLLLSLKLVPYIIGYAGFYMAYPWLDLAPFDLSWGFGPLLYIYTLRLTQPTLGRRWRLHFVPVAIQFSVYAVLFLQPMAFKNRFEDGIGPWFNRGENLFDCISFCAYLALTWAQIGGYERLLSQRFANPDSHRIRPLRLLMTGVSVTLLAFVGAKLWSLAVSPLSYYQMFPFYVLLTSVVYLFGFVAFQFAEVDFSPPPEPAEPKEIDWTAVAQGFSEEMERCSFWRDPLLSVAGAAKALDTTESRLSRAINSGLGVSFAEWVNRYRISQVVEGLSSGIDDGTIFELAQRCGFNSKASFHRWFRAVQGCTPTEFRQGLASSRAPEPHLAQNQYPPL